MGSSESNTPELHLHNRRIESIFELLGADENDITYSVGWTLAQSPRFLSTLLKTILPTSPQGNVTKISLQDFKQNGGVTDVEVFGPSFHVIIEAKRGWQLPSDAQLRRYAKRLQGFDRPTQALVVMAECSAEYAKLHLPRAIEGIAVKYLGWKEVAGLTDGRAGTHAEKRLLGQLRTYLRRIVRMQDQESNLVYVVALGADTPAWSRISWRDIVNKKRRYFHPLGGSGWPKTPPNYLGFRYEGRLQSIHHVDAWKVVENLDREIPEIKRGTLSPHLIYTLGEPIIPSRKVMTGNIYPNGRVWAMLDLLLTSKTIAEARDATKKRRG